MLDVLAHHLRKPTGRGLAEAVSSAIRSGEIVEGNRLPPIRTVANHLGVSPTTVSAAWSMLARAGTIRTDGRRGTSVARTSSGPTRYRRALGATQRFPLDLSTGVPDPELLPDLTAALTSVSRQGGRTSYLDEPILPGLVEVLRTDWPYDAAAFTVVDGAMDALQQIVSVHLRMGDVVLVEHPCFPPLLDLLESVGARVVGLRMDAAGVLPADLAAHVSGSSALILQTRAQNPTGVSMSAARAEELARVLASTDVLVVEDDSAGATSRTEPISLGRWVPDRTLHIRSFSKSHGPDLRLAAVSGPTDLVGAVNDRRFLGQGWSSRLLQSVLVHQLTHAEPRRQVEAARREYADRRNRIVVALREAGVPVPTTDGINLWLPVRDEVAALIRLAGQGIGVAAGGPFMVLPDESPHLRVTVGLVTEEHERVAAELAEAAGVGAWPGPR